MKKNLFVIGSLRKQRFNREVGELAKSMIQEEVEVSDLDCAAVYPMNQDIEYSAPRSGFFTTVFYLYINRYSLTQRWCRQCNSLCRYSSSLISSCPASLRTLLMNSRGIYSLLGRSAKLGLSGHPGMLTGIHLYLTTKKDGKVFYPVILWEYIHGATPI